MYTKILSLGRTVLLSQVFVPVAAFAIPFSLPGPQILVGTLVNGILFYSAKKFDQKFLWAVAVLPSLGALIHGVMFGKFTPFLFYFLPFIWIGNIVLIRTFRLVSGSLPVKIIASTCLKTLILYLSALVYFKFQIVPQLFLTSMGMIQFMTALSGGTLASLVLRISDERGR
jgi:hypothetical protein